MNRFSLFAIVLAFGLSWSSDVIAETSSFSHHISFANDVQPILRRHCYRCHGSKNQEAGLQLNQRSAAMGTADSGEPVIVKADADASLLIQRLVDEDQGDLMPLDGQPLSAKEVAVLRRWIDDGADWPDELAEAKHWAYQPIRRPETSNLATSNSPIDHFIQRRREQRGLDSSPPLDRARLIRRVSLALTGIPPTIEEIDEFIHDQSPNAYEKVVDRLLKSERYGERWAIGWLDLARYADSNGFQADQIRDNWAYRDWVIRAFNSDMPFDQFVIDQIAGDLRPDATVEQKIATGFHRMTTCNVEAGVHPEANRVNQIVDRVNTTATVFLGTTLECAQCHDHKYDPFTQQDYYQIFSYFNNTPLEVKNTSGVTWDFFGPTMDLPMGESQKNRLDSLQRQLAELEASREQVVQQSEEGFAQWLARLQEVKDQPTQWRTVKPEVFETSGGEDFQILEDGAVLLTGTVPDTVEHVFTLPAAEQPITAIKIDVLTDDAIPGKGPGRGDAQRSNIILSELTCELITDKEAIQLELQDPVADFSQTGWPVANAIDGNRKTGWAIAPQFGKPHWAAFTLASPLTLKPDSERLRITLGQFFGRGRVIGKPRISIFNGDPSLLNIAEDVIKLAAKEKLSKADRKKLRAEFDNSNPQLRQIQREIAKTKKEIEANKPDTTLVMVELEQPRETFVMIRGDYESLGDKVSPGTPAVLPKDDSIQNSGDRMEFALWLTSPKNPLLPRVTVNRWWAEIFGAGIVSTPEDFGTQGEDPSHPALLDWLANELISSGWSMKHLHKQMVMSETFQQTSRITPELLEADPENRLLACGPRFRLPAELIRDNALAISGLLSNKLHGPPIMPFQPSDIWRSVGRNQPKWVAADNENRFRRGLYVIWKRAAPYPSFINFDAPLRGSCTVNRSRSNTPLQALTLLNDPAYAEMSLAFADRVLSEAPSSGDRERLRYAVKLSVARDATDIELDLLQQLLDEERKVVLADENIIQARTKTLTAALKLRTADRAELAAWFAVANTLLNMDETMNQ